MNKHKLFNFEKVLNLLIEHFINMGNSVAGISYPVDNLLRFGEPLAKKAIDHIISSQQLCRGK